MLAESNVVFNASGPKKNNISCVLSTKVACSNKKLVEESSVECLSGTQLHRAFKERAIVAAKLRGIKTPQSTLRQDSGVEVAAEGWGILLGGQSKELARY